MTSVRKIAVVTGSRAEYGLLYWVMRDLDARADVELQVVVTGMHLSPEYGMTVREIEADGFTVSARVEMLLASDTAGGTCKSVGLAVSGLSDAFERLAPDLILVLGDRFEILAAAQAALFHAIPLGHIAGGDTTEGAYDEAIRHAITKMAHLHFVTNAQAAQRVIQMGESPNRVFLSGSPGLDHLKRRPLLDRPALEAALGASLGQRNILVTFHPVTLEQGSGPIQQGELLAALAELPDEVSIWITGANADTGGRELTAQLESWKQGRANVHSYASLGQARYLGLMAQVDAVVGNSSSGMYEAPSFGVTTVNIGDRQKGRLAASSVVHVPPERQAIASAMRDALARGRVQTENPYGDGQSAARIVEVLATYPLNQELLFKQFHLLEMPS